jgi:hypothetical protein
MTVLISNSENKDHMNFLSREYELIFLSKYFFETAIYLPCLGKSYGFHWKFSG